MSDLKTSVIIDLKGNLAARASRYTQSMLRFADRSGRAITRLRGGLTQIGRSLSFLGNKTSALLGGVTLGIAAKRVIDLEERYGRLGIQANRTNEDMQKLKRTIFETAQEPDLSVNPQKVLEAFTEIVEKTGDLQFAEQNIRNIAAAIQATGAEGQSIGGIMAEFQKMGIVDPSKVLEALDILNVQGKEGAFTLQNLAALGPRVVTAYTSMGRGGVGAIREMGAALQVIRQGTGSSEMAATAFEAVIRTLSDFDKIKQLESVGIKVFEDDEQTRVRSIVDLMNEIVEKSKGKKVLLSQIFDAEALRAFNAASSEFTRSGTVSSLDKFMNVMADGTTTLNDSARAAQFTTSTLNNLSSTVTRAADEMLSGPIKRLADETNKTLQGTGPDTLLGNLGSYEAERRVQMNRAAKSPSLERARKLQDVYKTDFQRGREERAFQQWKNNDFTGTVKIEIDQKMRARVKEIRSNNKDINIQVDNGLQVGGQ